MKFLIITLVFCLSASAQAAGNWICLAQDGNRSYEGRDALEAQAQWSALRACYTESSSPKACKLQRCYQEQARVNSQADEVVVLNFGH